MVTRHVPVAAKCDFLFSAMVASRRPSKPQSQWHQRSTVKPGSNMKLWRPAVSKRKRDVDDMTAAVEAWTAMRKLKHEDLLNPDKVASIPYPGIRDPGGRPGRRLGVIGIEFVKATSRILCIWNMMQAKHDLFGCLKDALLFAYLEEPEMAMEIEMIDSLQDLQKFIHRRKSICHETFWFILDGAQALDVHTWNQSLQIRSAAAHQLDIFLQGCQKFAAVIQNRQKPWVASMGGFMGGFRHSDLNHAAGQVLYIHLTLRSSTSTFSVRRKQLLPRLGGGGGVDYCEVVMKEPVTNWAEIGICERLFTDVVSRLGIRIAPYLYISTVKAERFRTAPNLLKKLPAHGYGIVFFPSKFNFGDIDGAVVTTSLDKHLHSADRFLSIQVIDQWIPSGLKEWKLHFAFICLTSKDEAPKGGSINQHRSGACFGVPYTLHIRSFEDALAALPTKELNLLRDIALNREEHYTTLAGCPPVPPALDVSAAAATVRLSPTDLKNLRKPQLNAIGISAGMDPDEHRNMKLLAAAMQAKGVIEPVTNWAEIGICERLFTDVVSRLGIRIAPYLYISTVKAERFRTAPNLLKKLPAHGYGIVFFPSKFNFGDIDGAVVTTSLDKHLHSADRFLSIQVIDQWIPSGLKEWKLHFAFICLTSKDEAPKGGSINQHRSGACFGVPYTLHIRSFEDALAALPTKELNLLRDIALNREEHYTTLAGCPPVPPALDVSAAAATVRLSPTDLKNLRKPQLNAIGISAGMDPDEHRNMKLLAAAMQAKGVIVVDRL
ncbi:hypothetical protein SELMODRAFT_426091 [Selaginella moellendorffii]|uniref:Uncharacterized protein n=1 Tax=Selaginella moellendorffii TaxID=88036 RepID=D8SVA5_SELML|nr:hypothetical protein SELMODRAFT_426091 [Selaginella moellendorffii]